MLLQFSIYDLKEGGLIIHSVEGVNSKTESPSKDLVFVYCDCPNDIQMLQAIRKLKEKYAFQIIHPGKKPQEILDFFAQALTANRDSKSEAANNLTVPDSNPVQKPSEASELDDEKDKVQTDKEILESLIMRMHSSMPQSATLSCNSFNIFDRRFRGEEMERKAGKNRQFLINNQLGRDQFNKEENGLKKKSNKIYDNSYEIIDIENFIAFLKRGNDAFNKDSNENSNTLRAINTFRQTFNQENASASANNLTVTAGGFNQFPASGNSDISAQSPADQKKFGQSRS